MNKWKVFSLIASIAGAVAGVIGHVVDTKIQDETIAKKVNDAIKNLKG